MESSELESINSVSRGIDPVWGETNGRRNAQAIVPFEMQPSSYQDTLVHDSAVKSIISIITSHDESRMTGSPTNFKWLLKQSPKILQILVNEIEVKNFADFSYFEKIES